VRAVDLVLLIFLTIFAMSTIYYHIMDVVQIFQIGKGSGIAIMAARFRAGIECRESYVYTHDESCYFKYDNIVRWTCFYCFSGYWESCQCV